MKYTKKNKIYILLCLIFISGLCIKINFNGNIDGMLESIGNFIYSQDNIYEKYMEDVNMSITQNGINIRLEKAAADNNVLILSFIVKGDYEIQDNKLNISKLTVNGLKINGEYMDYIEYVSQNEFRIIKKIYWNYDYELRDLNIDINVNKIFDNSGKWNFKFSLSNKRTADNIYVENIDKVIIRKDFESTIEKVIYSPLTVSINQNMSSKCGGSLLFSIFENDNELKAVSLKSNTKKYVFDNKPDSEEVRIVPIYYLNSRKEEPLDPVKVNLREFHQFYLDVNDNLKLKVEDCFYEDNKIIAKYKLEYLGIEINKKIADLYMNDKEGECNEVTAENYEHYKEKYGDDNSYIAVFESDEEDTIEIGCYDGTKYEVLDDEVIEVKKVLNDNNQ
ncbi:MAG: DUF4179 domain-containing protein [Clostridium sp.]|nr:DUF4179 domain-containing protein [Clostridium sp.]